MNSTDNPPVMDATSPTAGAASVASGENHASGKWAKKLEKTKDILSSGEFATMTSPTKRLVFYYRDHAKKGYHDIPKRVLFREYQVRHTIIYEKDRKEKNGFPYKHNTKCPILNDSEGEEFLAYIRNAESQSCVRLNNIVVKATDRCLEEIWHTLLVNN